MVYYIVSIHEHMPRQVPLELNESGGLRLNGIEDFQKRKPMEVRITRADSPDTILAHKNGCVRVVEQIA
jgi:hypothetical protein